MLRPYSRVIVFVAGLVMIMLAWFWSAPRPPQISDIKPLAPVSRHVEILVARHDLEPGQPLSDDHAEWIDITTDPADAAAVTRAPKSDMANPYLGRIVREPVKRRDALLPRHFLSSDSGSFLSGLITPGKRAFAIAIDTKGTASAGNFILPNDRVDMIRSSNSAGGLQSELIPSNIRVLAIGPNIRGEGVSQTGETATVEVDIQEAEILATAQRTGQISLALRHPQEAGGSHPVERNLVVIRPAANFEKNP